MLVLDVSKVDPILDLFHTSSDMAPSLLSMCTWYIRTRLNHTWRTQVFSSSFDPSSNHEVLPYPP